MRISETVVSPLAFRSLPLHRGLPCLALPAAGAAGRWSRQCMSRGSHLCPS